MKNKGKTRLKQRTAEWFNKEKRTVDEEFEQQNRVINEQIMHIRALYIHTEQAFNCYKDQMLQVSEMGSILRLLYADEPSKQKATLAKSTMAKDEKAAASSSDNPY